MHNSKAMIGFDKQSSPLGWLCAMQIGRRSVLQGGMNPRNPCGHSQEFLQLF